MPRYTSPSVGFTLRRGVDPAESDAAACFDEAQAEMDEASKLDPASPAPDTGRGDIELFGRENYSDAENVLP